MYHHRNVGGQTIALPAGKVVCVGRNYLDHINELHNAVPEQPLLFIKPSTSLCDFAGEILIPSGQGECHNEIEIAVLIKDTFNKSSPLMAMDAIWGYGLALDLTLREVQNQLKASGHPWERAKAFDGSCPVSAFVPASQINDVQNIDFQLKVKGQPRQSGNTGAMIFPIAELLAEISQHFTLQAGDIVLTGTPKGVAALQAGDRLSASLNDVMTCTARVEHG